MKRYLLAVVFLISLSLLPGCWDFQEADKLAFATVIGIDQGPGRNVNLSVQIPLTQTALPPVVSGGKPEKKFITINQAGKTVTEAFDLLETKSYRSIVLSQTKAVIIGAAAARRGVKPLLDHIIRTTQMPLPAYIFIADGIPAEAVLRLEPVPNMLPGNMFATSGQSVTKYDMAYFIPHWQFQQKLVHSSKDAYASQIGIDREQKVYEISGLAAFNGDRMVGKLTGNEVEVFGLLIGYRKSGLMTFAIPGGEFTLRNVRGSTKIRVDLEQGRPVFMLETIVRGALTELTTDKTLVAPEEIAYYQRIVARNIKIRITDLVRKLQEYNSDIVNFGEEFRVQHQKVWKKVDWKRVYPTSPFTVKVKVQIEGGRFR